MSRRGRLVAVLAVAAAAVLAALGVLAAGLLAGDGGEAAEATVPVTPAAEFPPPLLQVPAEGAAVLVQQADFAINFQGEGYLQVQYARDEAFPEGAIACDSGWYSSGFHTDSTWILPGPIGFSEVECRLEEGEYWWRARWSPGIVEGEPPSEGDPVSDWSPARRFTATASLEPPPPPQQH